MTVTITKELQTQIYAQMEDTFPNEGGGFLLGDRKNGQIVVEAIIQVENTFDTEEQYHRYAMTPENWAKIEDQADEMGLTLVGYYHSHPNSPAIASEYDRVHALPNFVYMITSVLNGKAVDMLIWLLREDRSEFDPVPFIVL